jgi:hypothetical protein
MTLVVATATLLGVLLVAPAGGAVADAPLNAHNCTGGILSANTPQDFHHGAEAERAVVQAHDSGRGDIIRAFTNATAGTDCR